MPEIDRCPECREQIFRDDFQCANCGLLLHPEQATGEYILTEPSIVRALISPNEPRATGEIPAVLGEPIEEVVTATFALPFDDDAVPVLIAGVDVALNPLHPFQAHVVSFIDGTSTIRVIQKASRVPAVELKSVLAALQQANVVDIRQPTEPGRPFPSQPTAVPIEEIPTNPRPRPTAPRGAFSRALDDLPPSGSRARPKVDGDAEETTTGKRRGGKGRDSKRGRAIAPAAKAPPPTLAPKGAAAAVAASSASAPGAPPRLAGRAALERALERAKQRTPPSALQERTGPEASRPDEFLQRAIALEREGKVDGAIYVLKRAIAQVNRPAPLYNKLALILINQRKDYGEAELLIRKALAADPSNTVYQQNLYTVLALAAETKSDKKSGEGGLWAKLRGK